MEACSRRDLTVGRGTTGSRGVGSRPRPSANGRRLGAHDARVGGLVSTKQPGQDAGGDGESGQDGAGVGRADGQPLTEPLKHVAQRVRAPGVRAAHVQRWCRSDHQPRSPLRQSRQRPARCRRPPAATPRALLPHTSALVGARSRAIDRARTPTFQRKALVGRQSDGNPGCPGPSPRAWRPPHRSPEGQRRRVRIQPATVAHHRSCRPASRAVRPLTPGQ